MARAAKAKGVEEPKQSSDRTKPDFEPSQDEKDAVTTWLARVKRCEEDPARKAWTDKLETLRGYVYGTKHKDPSGTDLTRTNLVFSTMAAMMPHLYARNPDIGVTPSAGCPKERLAPVKKFGTTAEAVLSQMLVKEGKLKRRAKANLRSVMTTSYGVLKMTFQKDLHADPLTLRRIQDAQDNLARIEALVADLKKEEDVATISRQRDELQAQLTGLMGGNEVRIFKGFVIDRLRSEDFLVLDDSVAEFDEYVDAGALGHIVWMTVAKFKAQFGFAPFGATRYNRPFAKGDNPPADAGDSQTDDEKFVCVVEIWDKDAQVVRTVAKGMNRWCREPYAPKNTSQRWYPFFVLGFNLVEGRWRPISDVELLMQLQDEYDTTRTNFADVRADAVPVRVFRKSGNLTEEDIKTLSVKRRNRDWIGIEGNPTAPISQDVMQLEGPKIDPQAYDVSLIRNDMDIVVGMSDASRANLIKPKTATEAEIMNQALGLRVDERRDANEDMITDMAEAALEIALRDMTAAEVKQIAGDDAEWPQMSVQEIFSLVDVSVRAGSSGKPNAAKDREQWTQLLPVVSDAITRVGELRAQGNYDMAESVLDLLRETLRRFGERIDVDALIPPVEKGEDGQPVAVAKQLQEAIATRQAYEECQAKLAQTEQALAQAKQAEVAKVAQIEADKALAAQKSSDEAQARTAEAAARAETEKYMALLKAAAEVLGRKMDTNRAAEEADAQGRTEEAEKARQAAEVGALVQGLREAMQALTLAVGQMTEKAEAGGAGRPAA